MEDLINLIKPDQIIVKGKRILRIAFLVDHFTFRGTCRAIFDYSDCSEILLGNYTYIVAPKKYDERNNLGVIFKFIERFKNIYFYDSLEDLEKYLIEKKVDSLYMIKGGSKCEISNFFEDRKSPIKLLIHCVYHCKDPHGYVYSAISPAVAKNC